MKARARKQRHLDRMYSHITTTCECCGKTRVLVQDVSTIRMCSDCEQRGAQEIDMGMYILDPNGIPIPCSNTLAWGAWMAKAWRRKKMRVADECVDGYRISTVFLGLDHGHFRFFGKDKAPLLYETMVFTPNPREDEEPYTARYHTAAEAKADNERVTSIIRMHAKNAEQAAQSIMDKLRATE